MVSQHVYNLCRASTTVSSEVAADPSMAPSEARHKLYSGGHAPSNDHSNGNKGGDLPKDEPFTNAITVEELQKARECGNWGGAEPSELFLHMYYDVLQTLVHDPLQGMVSPPLLGSSGTMPLTVMSTIPDVCRHMSNCIARAEHDVFLATNYWFHGEATKLIVNSIRELSRRAGEKGERRVVKIIYDRGSPKQFVQNHLHLSEADWTADAIKLPKMSEIPHIDMEVMNYHRPVFGTFHSKYLVVDRRVAIVSSNNIQDNDNMEMMTHMEGPIADSFYDLALNSWHDALKPPLPTLSTPARDAKPPAYDRPSFAAMFDPSGKLRDLVGVAPTDSAPDAHQAAVSALLDAAHDKGQQLSLAEHTGDDSHYDEDIAGEILRSQAVMRPRAGEGAMAAVTRKLNTVIQPNTRGDAPECDPADAMVPMVPLPAHAPVPIAMVCRPPHGAPDLGSVAVPQNAAFLSALRHAQRSVFIQTPNLNAKPLVQAISAACRRGVMVTYYVCLGYNDAGELLPLQGGTNEMFANKLLAGLEPEHRKNLDVYYYVGKDRTAPVHNSFKQRSCHIKLLIADDHVGVQGNGNQDTQSWFHSQETNVMVDSPTICQAWIEAVRRNQNTHLYGRAWRGVEADGGDSNDADGNPKALGCWYGSNGRQAENAIGTDPGHFSWARGFVGAVQRVRGMGGF